MQNQLKILFVTRRSTNCGVADYGKRLYTILKTGMDITLCEVDSMANIDYTGYDIALYNYHHATLPFISCDNKAVKHVALFHEAFQTIHPDQWVNVSELPRALMPFSPDIKYPISVNDSYFFDYTDEMYRRMLAPIIGSFGFGFADKNYSGICKMVKREYENATIKLHIPYAQYGDRDGSLANLEIAKCIAALSGSNIKLEVSHHFVDPDNMVKWLSENDLNIFNCIPTEGRGISSSIDYALSARRPIGISNSEMYRHLPREICTDNISLPRLIAQGIEPLRKVYEENSNERLIEAVKTKLGF